MPPSPKMSKKSGAPKAKGAVRAKSGCYTCRIRRKKCDEEPNADGDCKTCVRLHLECLGFGAKRPEWLRENRNVLLLREKIKGFLASQGLIKGTSGSGPRIPEQETQILRLTETNGYSSSSASPPTPVLSLPDPDFRPGPIMSSERENPYTPMSYNRNSDLPSLSPINADSPYTPAGRAPFLGSDDLLSQSYASIPHHNNIVSEFSPWSNAQQTFSSRASFSSFSPTYTARDGYDDEYDDYNTAVSPLSIQHPRYLGSQTYSDALVHHYMSEVLNIQYLLADQIKTASFMYNSIYASQAAREAVCLLSEVHRWCMRQAAVQTDDEIQLRYRAMHQKLIDNRSPMDRETMGDAMAGLHVVSSFLFSGGSGQWQIFLAFSSRYAKKVLHNPVYSSVAEALIRCSEADRFVVKTTMWFDVLASASQITVPVFLEEIRELFDPSHARINDSTPEEFDMMSVMGCRNHVVWAMAEISNLACWKEDAQRNCRLSMPGLVEKGYQIEEHLRPRGPMPAFDLEDTMTHRYLTSEIFRASARVYLHSVMSGDYPSCPDIRDAVNETISILEIVPTLRETSRSVIRSVVFSVFICGCLTDSLAQRDYLLGRLKTESSVETVGNCSRVRSLVEEVWKEREKRPLEPVRWKEALKKGSMLLV